MVVVPAGKFTMGSPKTGKDDLPTELPEHEVTALCRRKIRRDACAMGCVRSCGSLSARLG
jgi:hypothetical protein